MRSTPELHVRAGRAYRPPWAISSACEPCSTMRPALHARRCGRRARWSTAGARSPGWCARHGSALQRVLHQALRSRCRAPRWPRPAAAPGASLYSARAIASRWRWPPDSWAALWPSTVSMPSGSVATWAARLASSQAALHAFAVDGGRAQGHVGGDAVVEHGHVLADQGELRPQRRQRPAGDVAAVQQHLRPTLGCTKRGSRLISVVLPAPDGPTRATISPARTCRLSWRSTGSLVVAVAAR
jgi:hypothetical protein